jgi:hypothetical protein
LNPPDEIQGSGAGAMTLPRPAIPEWRVPEDILDKAVSLLLMVFLFFFFVGSKFRALGLPVRMEDLIFVMLVPMSYRYLTRPKTPLFYWIALYFGINLIPYFAWAVVGDYNLSYYPIITVKEMEYLYIAYLISVNRNKWVLAAVDGLALLMIAYGVREILSGRISYYGIGAIGSATAPSLSGAMYLFATMWLHMRSKLLKRDSLRRLMFFVLAAGSICVVATVSRSSILGLVVYWTAYLFLANLKWIPWLFAGMAISVPLIQSVADPYASGGYRYIALGLIRRMGRVGSAATARSDKWKHYIGEFSTADLVFGRGKGYPNARDKTISMGVDSQYVRTIMENGIVGVLIVAILMIYFLYKIYSLGGEIEHAVGITLAMLVMCIPFEAMQVSKSGGFFWLTYFYMLQCQRKLAPATA